jgi:hypothetical protein
LRVSRSVERQFYQDHTPLGVLERIGHQIPTRGLAPISKRTFELT